MANTYLAPIYMKMLSVCPSIRLEITYSTGPTYGPQAMLDAWYTKTCKTKHTETLNLVIHSNSFSESFFLSFKSEGPFIW